MSQRLQTLRGLLADFEKEALGIHEDVAREVLSHEDAISLGFLLASMVKKASGALEPIKGQLREEALSQNKGAPGPRQFTAPDGSMCVVVVPKSALQIRKGTNMEALKKDLQHAFGEFFTERVRYSVRKNFQKTASTHPLAKTAMAVIDFSDGTPRVSFKD